MQPKTNPTLSQAALQNIVQMFGPNYSPDQTGRKYSVTDVSSLFQAFADMPYSSDI